MELVEDTAWLALMGLRGPKADLPARQREAGRPRSKAKSATNGKQNGRARPRTLTVLHGGLEPIEVTDEMVDLIIVTHETQKTMVNHLRRGHCVKDDEDERCKKCAAFGDAANRLRLLAHTPAWTVDGLVDQEKPPRALAGNPRALSSWQRGWELREELIRRAKLRLGEA